MSETTKEFENCAQAPKRDQLTKLLNQRGVMVAADTVGCIMNGRGSHAPRKRAWKKTTTSDPAARVNYHLRTHAVERNIDDATLSDNETLSRLMDENQRLMTTRRATLGTKTYEESWFARLSAAQQANQQLVSGIASYREMFQWTGTSPLGPSPEEDAPEQTQMWGSLVKAMAQTNNGAHATTLLTSTTHVNAEPSPQSIGL